MTKTKSQPKPLVITPAAGALTEAVIEAIDYCAAKGRPVPIPVQLMFPCIQDALDSHDDVWIEEIHTYFGIVVSGCVLGEHVWFPECQTCHKRFKPGVGYYQHPEQYVSCTACDKRRQNA
jgi:hypothetical protein